MAVLCPQLNRLRVHHSRKGSNTASVVPGEANCRVVAAMHQHGGQELSFGVDFSRPESKFRRFNRAILGSYTNAVLQPPMFRNQQCRENLLSARDWSLNIRVLEKKDR